MVFVISLLGKENSQASRLGICQSSLIPSAGSRHLAATGDIFFSPAPNNVRIISRAYQNNQICDLWSVVK